MKTIKYRKSNKMIELIVGVLLSAIVLLTLTSCKNEKPEIVQNNGVISEEYIYKEKIYKEHIYEEHIETENIEVENIEVETIIYG